MPISLDDLKAGDTIYAAVDLYNDEDGGIPEIPNGGLIAGAGARGVIVNIGHLEEDEDQQIYLIRFEDASLNLGPPVGCLPEELSATPLS